MQKRLNSLIIISLVVVFVSCEAKTSTNTSSVITEKKAKLEALKKQQQQLSDQIATMEKEIITLDPSAKPEKTKLVSVTKLESQNFNHYIDLQGKVDANNISYVTTRGGAAGQVKAIYVKEGDYVTKGKLLLKLDDALSRKQHEQAETQLSFAKDIYNRKNNLWKENIGTEV